jgi:hypothetical protein
MFALPNLRMIAAAGAVALLSPQANAQMAGNHGAEQNCAEATLYSDTILF